METIKRCPKCELYLSIFEFYKGETSEDGLYEYCRDCREMLKKKNLSLLD